MSILIRNKNGENQMEESLLSIIIPTYNSGSTLDACLRSIKEQTYKNIEVIIVDRFSTDDTMDIAKKYGIKIIEDISIRSKARNIGVEISKGSFILSVDSDMKLTDRVVEECIEKSYEFDSIIISEMSFGTSFWANCKALEKKCYAGDDDIEAARFFSRDMFDSINGYDSSLEFGEDWDIHQRIRDAGFKMGRIKSLIMHNEGNLTLYKTIKRQYIYGKSIEMYKRKHAKYFSKQSKLIRPAFVKNWKLLLRYPFLSIGMLSMKFCEFASIGTGYLLTKVK